MTAPVCVPECGNKQRFLKDCRGHVAITFGLMGAILMMSVGIATDIGRAMQAHQKLQKALDIAALAAIKSPAAARPDVATAFFRENSVGSIGTVSTPEVETLSSGALKISARVSVPTIVTRLMRVETIEMDAVAIAESGQAAPSAAALHTGSETIKPCLHILDETATESWRLAGSSRLAASECEVYVRSASAHAATIADNVTVAFQAVRVVGGIEQQGEPVAVAGPPYAVEPSAPEAGDPFATAVEGIAGAITAAPCSGTNTHVTITGGTASPGTYCGRTTFDGVTFAPGVYVIASGAGVGEEGRLTIAGSVDGSAGVTFYFADGNARIASIATTSGTRLSAPAVGLTRGLLFAETAVGKTAWSIALEGLGPQSWSGVVYLPAASVALRRLRDWSRLEIALVARTLEMTELSGPLTPFAWTPSSASESVAYGPALSHRMLARLSR